MTNSLLAVVVTLLGTGGVMGSGAYNDLRESVQELRSEVVKISANQEAETLWREHHENRPHEKTSALLERETDERRELEGRIVALELAVRHLSGRLDERKR